MFKDITVFLLVMMALREALVEGNAGLRFSGRMTLSTGDPSHAEYEPWNWRPNATLQFFFQTSSHEDALIFYQDDGARKDQFMDLFLLNGKARFRARVGRDMDEFERRDIQQDFADSKWHQVKIEVSEKEIMFSIDDIRPSEPTIAFTQNAESSLNGPLYVAGIPMALRQFSYPGIFREVLFPRPSSDALFEGCIGDIRINRSPNGRLERARLRKPPIDAVESCSGACAERRCYNKGRCIDRIRESECDCSGTGYEGNDCETHSKIVQMNINAHNEGGGYIYQRLESNSPYLSTERNMLDFRFLTLAKDGVIFYMGKDKDHLLVELVNGSVRVQADFGGGPVVVQLGKNALSDSCWYYAMIRRRKTRLTVILKDDSGDEIGRETRNSSATHVTLNLNNQSNVIYYGGGPQEVLRFAQAKSLLFKGYLQQFHFEELSVIDDALSDKNGFSITDKDRVWRAWLSNILLQAAERQCKENEGSGCSPSEDDSDSCKPSSIPTQAATRSTTPSPTPTTRRRNPPKPETQRPEEQKASPTARAKGVSAWVIILIVLAAIALVSVSVFLLYRWNHRYTGSFKPNKNAEGQPQEPGAEAEQQSTRVYNQPAFFVYKAPKKPPTAQSPPVSI